jgi:hypothetical protein
MPSPNTGITSAARAAKLPWTTPFGRTYTATTRRRNGRRPWQLLFELGFSPHNTFVAKQTVSSLLYVTGSHSIINTQWKFGCGRGGSYWTDGEEERISCQRLHMRCMEVQVTSSADALGDLDPGIGEAPAVFMERTVDRMFNA